MEILILVIIIFFIVQKKKTSGTISGTRSTPRKTEVKKSFTAPKKPKASAVPNQPKKAEPTRTEARMQERTRASSEACHYEAAYSKGKPDRIGARADYEPVTPSGRDRVRCPYCGAENFVPAGTHDHYHCYFCWEKL